MRYQDLLEDPALKKEIIAVVKATDDSSVLQKVLRTLKAGNIEDRIKSVLGKDEDASVFLTRIARSIIDIDAPVEEKDAFLKRIETGTAIDIAKLLDGKLQTFDAIVGSGFGKELFKDLSTELTAQGVGPCEVALAVLHPNIAWSGRIKGGGDVIINKRPIEVIARAAKGGRWINARKANLDLTGIRKAMMTAAGPKGIGDRVGIDAWVNQIRPRINPKNLKAVCKTIADATFNHVNNSEYQKALMSGDESSILYAIAKVGYNNYKKYSAFEGMLIMDLPSEQAQYFKDFDDMVGQISVKTAYILAPEAEMMPQVELSPGATIRAGRFDVEKTLPGQEKSKLSKQKIATIAQAAAREMAYERGISDAESIAKIRDVITAEYTKGTPAKKIANIVYKMFPKAKKVQPKQPVQVTPQPAPAMATAATPAPSAQRPVFPQPR